MRRKNQQATQPEPWDRSTDVLLLMGVGPTSKAATADALRRIRQLRTVIAFLAAVDQAGAKVRERRA